MELPAPEGESYADLFARVQAWHVEIEGDIVLAAHGGVARTLMVLYGVCPADDATTGTIDQGVVYEFADGSDASAWMTRSLGLIKKIAIFQ